MGRRGVPRADGRPRPRPGRAPPSTRSSPSFGRLDILVNNAGLAGEPGRGRHRGRLDPPSTSTSRALLRQPGGRPGDDPPGQRADHDISSQAGSVALPAESVYCMTKAAIAHLTKCLAVEWGRHGITVNCVAPTFIRTPGTEPPWPTPAFEAEVVERIAALHRIGDPMDVAGAVLFLSRRPPSWSPAHPAGRRWLDRPLTARRCRRTRRGPSTSRPVEEPSVCQSATCRTSLRHTGFTDAGDLRHSARSHPEM